MRARSSRPNAGRPHAPRRPPLLSTAPPGSRHPACWEIHRERGPESEQFAIYLEGARIGAERGAAELRELLVGARLRADDVERVLATLVLNPVVWIEIRPAEGERYRGPGA
ncbi:MAG TPA: hypothetical protein VFL12_12190 [Thermoanaerobaculia bacterium]|nr:hypothetical protein [Thermoanaerobaculia bacterium]